MESEIALDVGQPRFRMFAGPNGSGKSTLKGLIAPEWLGVYINPDEIQRQVVLHGRLEFADYGLQIRIGPLLDFMNGAGLLVQNNLTDLLSEFVVKSNTLYAPQDSFTAYHASVLAAYLRGELLARGRNITIETVMSSPDKVELLSVTRNLGYRNYLYFIATDSPSINLARVRFRVANGGHSVPESKIVSRYYRSLELLSKAIELTDRAFIFDNSREDDESLWIAEITRGIEVEGRSELVPAWFTKYVCSIPEDA